jgi:hypothetical protein
MNKAISEAIPFSDSINEKVLQILDGREYTSTEGSQKFNIVYLIVIDLRVKGERKIGTVGNKVAIQFGDAEKATKRRVTIN